MTGTRAIILRSVVTGCSLMLLVSLGACFGKDKARIACDDRESYQSVVDGSRVEVPDGLDPLDELKELPLPKAETPPRREGAGCIESPPSILSGGSATT